ncbi:class I SAM-dependent methyltransferase [Roseibium aggregatum]|uniref:Class I SAM-dependent methyltransferase n=1 Tax=Roseibium aggregatum TaxID=187304 RepID=A0A939IZ04_9HYPH|nr:class I SAM-dependent methyltransferase [Roseibium aggregatum]MBN9669536.1 class I SAM-dependent methyltransferase [Roseibium aggregatum]
MTTTWTNGATPSQTFWDRIARKYAAAPVRNQEAYEKTLALTLEHLGPDDAVLELGCGTGTTALLLAGNVSAYLATDFAPGMIRIAEEKLADEKNKGTAPEGLRFAVADIHDEQIASAGEGAGGYDAILAFNFLHLVEDPDNLLARVNGLLKPGGLFISKSACLKKRAWLFAPLVKILQLLGKAPFVRMLSFRALEEMIEHAGFEIVETGTYPAPFSRFVVARKPGGR